MKKLLFILVVIGFLSSLIACGNNVKKVEETTALPRLSYELALVIGPGSVEDGKENEAVWNGIKKYAEEKNKLYKSFQATNDSTIELFAKIEESIKDGGNLVVCVGEAFAEAVYYAEQSYPDIHFVLYDGEPLNSEKEPKIANNAIVILYDGETVGLINKTISENTTNTMISSKLTSTMYDIAKKHYNGDFDGGSKKSLQ